VGEPSYRVTDADAGEIVEDLLGAVGELDFYESRVDTEKNKMQAKASFLNRDAAIRAEAQLNKKMVPELGNSR
jgi:hypothetical protein